jgi:hypothetical protein
LGPDLGLALQPHIRLLELRYPVDDLRIKVNRHLQEHNRASNAVRPPSARRVVGRYARLKPEQIFLAVHRVEFIVYYRRLDPAEFGLLAAIGAGQSIGVALEAVAGLEPEKVSTWFANWAQLGWLCKGDA